MSLFDAPTLSHYIAQALADENNQPQEASRSATKASSVGPWPYLALLGSEGADIGTSLYDEKVKGTHEANPIINGMPGGLIASKIGLTLAMLYLMHKEAQAGNTTAAKWIGYLSAIPPSAAAIHNIMIPKEQK